MIFNKTLMITFLALLGVYLLYKLLFSTNKVEEEYNSLYNKILKSDDSKVKGQYDK